MVSTSIGGWPTCSFSLPWLGPDSCRIKHSPFSRSFQPKSGSRKTDPSEFPPLQTYHDYIAKTFRGLENVLSDELISLGVKQPAFITRGVRFHGTRELVYRILFVCIVVLI